MMRLLRRHRRLFMGLVEAVFLAALCGFLLWLQGHLSTASQQRQMEQKVEQLRQGFATIADVETREASLVDLYNEERVSALAYAIRHGALEARRRDLQDFCERVTYGSESLDAITNILVLDRKGRKLAQAYPRRRISPPRASTSCATCTRIPTTPPTTRRAPSCRGRSTSPSARRSVTATTPPPSMKNASP